MDPNGPNVFAEPLSDVRRPEAAAVYQRETERFAKLRAERSPRDAAAGREALRAIVSAAVSRLEGLREQRTAAEAESVGLSEVSARMSFRAKETVEWLWKHQARCSRSLCRTLDELRKVRRDCGDDLPAPEGPMSAARGPSSGSEMVAGSDLPATGAGPAAVEPDLDLDARDVTDVAIALAVSFSVTAGEVEQTMDRTNEAIAPPVTTDDAPRTADLTSDAGSGRLMGGSAFARGSHDPARMPDRRSPSVLRPPDGGLEPRSHRLARAPSADKGRPTRADRPRLKSRTTDGGPRSHRPGPARATLLHSRRRGLRHLGAGSCGGTQGVPRSPSSARGPQRPQRDERTQPRRTGYTGRGSGVSS